MPTFRKIPIEIEAVQWFRNGDAPIWAKGKITEHGTHFVVASLEGHMMGRRGDWIIKGIINEIYICAGYVFAQTYEAA